MEIKAFRSCRLMHMGPLRALVVHRCSILAEFMALRFTEGCMRNTCMQTAAS